MFCEASVGRGQVQLSFLLCAEAQGVVNAVTVG